MKTANKILLGFTLGLMAGVCFAQIPKPGGGSGGGASPAGTGSEIQARLNGTTLQAVTGSQTRSNGSVEIPTGLNTPFGGFGLTQNLLFQSATPDGSNWSQHNVTTNSD